MFKDVREFRFGAIYFDDAIDVDDGKDRACCGSHWDSLCLFDQLVIMFEPTMVECQLKNLFPDDDVPFHVSAKHEEFLIVFLDFVHHEVYCQ